MNDLLVVQVLQAQEDVAKAFPDNKNADLDFPVVDPNLYCKQFILTGKLNNLTCLKKMICGSKIPTRPLPPTAASQPESQEPRLSPAARTPCTGCPASCKL